MTFKIELQTIDGEPAGDFMTNLADWFTSMEFRGRGERADADRRHRGRRRCVAGRACRRGTGPNERLTATVRRPLLI